MFKLSQRPVRGESVSTSNCESKNFQKGSSREDQGIWQCIYSGNKWFSFLSRVNKKEILKGRKKNPSTITLEVIPHPDVSVIKYFIKQKEILICHFKSSPAGKSLISKGRSARCIGQEQ